jgi:hypothetical protein
LIQLEIKKQQSAGKEMDLGIKLARTKKARAAVDFWSHKVDDTPSQHTKDRRKPVVYKYHEGFTNAVRWPVYLARIIV